MRYFILVVLAASVICVSGCGGGGPPAGYTVQDGWVTTPSGLQYKDTAVGYGEKAQNGDTLTVNYTGRLADGTVFDSSLQEGRDPFTFTLGAGEVIRGWDEGLLGVREGGKVSLVIPPSLGYGDVDMGDIPPNSTLYFEVEVLSVS